MPHYRGDSCITRPVANMQVRVRILHVAVFLLINIIVNLNGSESLNVQDHRLAMHENITVMVGPDKPVIPAWTAAVLDLLVGENTDMNINSNAQKKEKERQSNTKQHNTTQDLRQLWCTQVGLVHHRL